MTPADIESHLAQFCGTENWYRHWASKGRVTYTDGVQSMAEMCDAYWLIDVIASYQDRAHDLAEKTGGFQLWEFKKDSPTSGVVTCRRDTGAPVLVEQKIGHTDFPLDEIRFYVEGPYEQTVILLPGEH